MRFEKQCFFLILGILIGIPLLTMAASGGVRMAAQVMAPRDTSHIIVIDPGHGGEDGGAVSCTGAPESRINLQISRRLEALLGMLGMRVRMTRSEDVSLHSPEAETVSEKKVSDLKNRVKLVNETLHPILISIHQNMFSEERYAGAQVFYADSEASRRLAELTQTTLRQAVDPNNHREIKKSLSVYLMNKIRCPGILIECGFLSNRAEESKLRTEIYQKQLACAIASGLRQYLLEEDQTHPEETRTYP